MSRIGLVDGDDIHHRPVEQTQVFAHVRPCPVFLRRSHIVISLLGILLVWPRCVHGCERTGACIGRGCHHDRLFG